MPVENDVMEMCKSAGVRDDEAASMVRAGVTGSALAICQEYGIGPKKVRDWFYQFGPSAVPVLNEFVLALKPPKPKEASVRKPKAKPKPAPEPADAPGGDGHQ